MATANMNLTLPTPSVSIGPAWATALNTAFEAVDEHDHSSGKGVKITPAGLNITADLDMQSNATTNLGKSGFVNQASPLSGATHVRSLNVSSGNLYFVNDAGVSVQITDGSALLAAPAAVTNYETQAVSSNLTIGPSDTFVFLIVDTSVARQITLPLANGVADGRFYILKDATGSSRLNNITVVPQGSDTIDGVAGNKIIDSDSSSITIVGDGTSAWYIS